jgi:hypothetical protein
MKLRKMLLMSLKNGDLEEKNTTQIQKKTKIVAGGP